MFVVTTTVGNPSPPAWPDPVSPAVSPHETATIARATSKRATRGIRNMIGLQMGMTLGITGGP